MDAGLYADGLIFETASRLFRERGFDAVTVVEVAWAAERSRHWRGAGRVATAVSGK